MGRRADVQARSASLQQELDALQVELASLPEDRQAVECGFMTLDDYAARASMNTRTLRRLISDGLPCTRPHPRTIRINVAAADA